MVRHGELRPSPRWTGALLVALLGLPSAALACRCAQAPLTRHYSDADLVFIGAATPAAPRLDSTETATFVETRFVVLGEPYKGDPLDVYSFRTAPDSAGCGVPIETGASYLVFAKRDLDQPTVAHFDGCGGSRPFDPMKPAQAAGFPDVIAERVPDALLELRTASDTVARKIGGIPSEGSTLGLLELPSTFHRDRDEVVAQAPYAPLPLRAKPDLASPVVATATSEADLLTREYGYGLEGAVVVAEREGWLQLRTEAGVLGWAFPPPSATYHRLETLLPKRLGYLTPAWDGRFWPAPGAGLPFEPGGTLGSRVPVLDIVGSRRVADSLWFEVKLWRHNPCDGPEQNSAEYGWIPAWAPSGEVTLWFWSRGC